MYGLRAFIFLMLFLCGVPQAGLAGEVEPVDVIIDQAHLIRLDRDAARIIVGNPAIADVAVEDGRLLVITGKSYGSTNLIALERSGETIVSVRLSVREGDARRVTLYRGTARQSFHCTPVCQRTLSIGDDRSDFEQLAETVSKKFGVVNSAIGGGR